MWQATRYSLLCLASFAALVTMGAAPRDARATSLEIITIIGGQELRCWDFRGTVVMTNWTDKLGDVGRAWFVNRRPIIALDSHRMARLPSKLQIFFYGHECAHHVLGHYFNRTTSSEKEADCWSIKNGRERGFLTREDVKSFAPYFAHSRGSPFGHLPGHLRAEFMLSCFDDPSTAQKFAAHK